MMANTRNMVFWYKWCLIL